MGPISRHYLQHLKHFALDFAALTPSPPGSCIHDQAAVGRCATFRAADGDLPVVPVGNAAYRSLV